MIDMDFDFDFEPVQTPWDLAVQKMKKGDTLAARRFLELIACSDEVLADDAALELEQRGVMLDVSELPVYQGNPETEKRLKLEEKLLKEGALLESLEKTDPLWLYLTEMESIPQIADGSELAARGAAGDENAMQQLTGGYLKCVMECAEEFMGRGVLLLDLIQEGSLGLWQGILNYEGGDFRPHAVWWIRQAMARAVTLQAQANGIQCNLSDQIARFRKADQKLLTELGRNPTLAEIAHDMGVTMEEAEVLEKNLREMEALDKIKKAGQKPEKTEEDDQAVEDTAYYHQRQRIDEMLSGLTAEEQNLVILRYGLDGRPPMTAEEVGSKLGLSVSEVIAAETAALGKMRHEGE